MVARERKEIDISYAEQLLAQYPDISPESLVKKMKEKPVRQPKPEPPVGGICINQASHKYDIPQQTLSRWVQRGLIPVLVETRNEKYVDESVLAERVRQYKANPGKGKRNFEKTRATVRNSELCKYVMG
ncbi:MAG: helix-turn-helix domain-containing protein [Patescibacteria group bacterium]|jgi:hypothetical protein